MEERPFIGFLVERSVVTSVNDCVVQLFCSSPTGGKRKEIVVSRRDAIAGCFWLGLVSCLLISSLCKVIKRGQGLEECASEGTCDQIVFLVSSRSSW